GRREKELAGREAGPSGALAAPACTAAQLQRQLEEFADIMGDEVGRTAKSLLARIERLEKFEEIQQLKAENDELRKKAQQLERRVVFVDLSKQPAAEPERDAVVDLSEARATARGSRDAA